MFWVRMAWLGLMVVAAFVGPIVSWAAGVIILPSLGLKTPTYWDWFFLGLVLGIGALFRGMLKGFFKGLNAWGEHDE